MTRQTDLSEFGEELSAVRADSQLEWAAVQSGKILRREDAFSDITPEDPNALDEGLEIVFELASGRVIEEWFEKPTEWDMMSNNLVLLLEYWELDPGDIEQLNDEENVFEIPVEHDDSVGDFRPDWQAIEQTIHTRQLEEEDDG